MTASSMSARTEESTPPSSPPSAPSPLSPGTKGQDGDGAVGVTKTMHEEEARMAQSSARDEEKRRQRLQDARQKDLQAGDAAMERKFKQLQVLLDKSNIYAKIMYDQMKAEQAKAMKVDAKREETDLKDDRKGMRTSKTKGAKGANGLMDYFKKDIEAKAGKGGVKEALAEAADDFDPAASKLGHQNLRSARQPDLVSGGNMRGYQLEGLEWLTSLYENGLNGILADEMGLGKTVQTISFLAFLRSKQVFGPFLVAAPLSTLGNWVEEFRFWTPDIPVLCYHGTPAERAELRRKHMGKPSAESFPVICTSYEISMNDKKFLSKYGWKYIVIDEGHRLKNYNCKLIRDLKTYNSSNRLLITGTPLQNNLRELWSLLSFVMPDIFNEWETFESWFDFSALEQGNENEQILKGERRNNIVGSLHAILKPFLLRRVKADVESDLPRKREYVIYAPLSQTQKDLYDAIYSNQSREFLENKAVERLSGRNTPNGTTTPNKRKAPATDTPKGKTLGADTPNKSLKSSRASTPGSTASARRRGKKNYRETSDREFFKAIETGEAFESEENEEDEDDEGEMERAHTLALARKEVSTKKLQNPVMQMRLACNSPHNFFYPFTETSSAEEYSALVQESGKMTILDELVPFLFSRGHKILLFSQFKTQLDLLEDWADLVHGWPTCRIDGSVAQEERQTQIDAFAKDTSHKLFLLSTRAGGQGINLAAADTVILFDSDWNPQQDLQAQDRAHRIGQTKPVVVFRLTTAGTVEQKLLEKADSKRKLEKLVIRKGKFRSLLESAQGGEEVDDLADFLKRDEDDADAKDQQNSRNEQAGKGKKFFTTQDLKELDDRSPKAYDRAEEAKGVVKNPKFKIVETERS